MLSVKRRSQAAVLVVFAFVGVFGASTIAAACGGFFCSNDPVDQVAERIVFTVNDDGTITSLIEIAYQGEAADFSWVLPIPEPISANDIKVPEGGPEVFDSLHQLTDPRILSPDRNCSRGDEDFATASDASAEEDGGVEVFASGEVGPFGFDVIGSSNPAAMIDWLRDNNYTVDQSMEPLIDVYVEEEFSFIAMRLLDGETSESIAPVELTYPGTQPMIPLRLTAIAAFDNMPIFTWFFADEQVVPDNYGHMSIHTDEITFFEFSGNNYTSLVRQRADAFDGGQAFITEYAGPASELNSASPYVQERSDRYLTRLTTYISPEEMTVDPLFTFDADADDVSNIRDASDRKGLVSCQRESARAFFLPGDAIDPTDGTGAVLAMTPARPLLGHELVRTFAVLALLAGAVGAFYMFRAGRLED